MKSNRAVHYFIQSESLDCWALLANNETTKLPSNGFLVMQSSKADPLFGYVYIAVRLARPATSNTIQQVGDVLLV